MVVVMFTIPCIPYHILLFCTFKFNIIADLILFSIKLIANCLNYYCPYSTLSFCTISAGTATFSFHCISCICMWLKLLERKCLVFFCLSLSQGLRKRQVDMIEDGVCGSSKSLTRVTTLLREICGEAIRRLERRREMQIGGRRAFVSIDESKFRHKRKVRFCK